jgi:anti-sigma-K factor RskA
MAHSERHEELVAAVALGLPIGEDRLELEAHLAEGCVGCDGLRRDLREAATALAVEAPAATPPPELRARILASLGPARVAPRPAPAAAWRALAAAATVFAVLLLVDDASLRRQREELRSRSADLAVRLQSSETELAQRVLRARVLESDDVQMLILGGKDPQPGARGRVFWSERARRGVLVASNLAPLPADRQYELWVFLKGKPVNAGVFDADAEGRALFESTDFPESDAQNFAVTIEPRGGVPDPTGPAVLVGSPST